ncbi:MAG TPA: glycosyltransferase, partial [Candidatus Acidoferrum sp.]|nr:glycosyltransferase [Candidatus Acidoferrum sp.]
MMPYILRFLPLKPAQVARILWWTMLSIYNKLDMITTPTETAASILRRQPVRVPIRAISCGVDTRRFAPRDHQNREEARARFHIDRDKPLLIYVGRLDPEKRLDLLLEAFSLQHHPDARLVVGGYGSQGGALVALARRLGISDRVTFTGYIPQNEMPLLLASADIFCMPSPEELQSIATLEAMASGKPILAANARALPELVANEVNGMLFTPGDARDAARAMDVLLGDPSAWPRLGQASLERVQKHSLKVTIRQYEQVYRTLIPSMVLEEEPDRELMG